MRGHAWDDSRQLSATLHMGKTPHGGCNRAHLASNHESLSIEEYIDYLHVLRGFMRQPDQGTDCDEQTQTGV